MTVQTVLNRYDAENDAGPVTWADVELAYEIKKLHVLIRQLEERLPAAEHTVSAATPELLAVCEQVLAWASADTEEGGDFAYFSEHIWHRLEDVVKKAKGE